MKPKILFLLHFPPPIHGSSMVGLSIKESEKMNASFDCSYFDLMASNNINESGKITLKKIIGFFNIWIRLASYLIKNKPALCYMALTTTGAAFKRDVLIVALLKLFRVKRVYHLHNKGVSYYSNKKLFKFLYAFVFKNSHTILLSDKLYSDISNFVPKESVRICPNGIKVQDETEPVTVNAVPRILFLSNLIESKGVKVLIDACKLLSCKNVSFTCDFVGGEGDINENRFNRYIADADLGDRVFYRGKMTGKEKAIIYNSSDIFAFPTYYSNECFPLVILEAMQAGLPVVSTFEGGIPDIIDEGKNGFVVPQKDVELLAERLEVLLNDKILRLNMGESGREKYLKEFTFERFEQRLTDILVELTNDNLNKK